MGKFPSVESVSIEISEEYGEGYMQQQGNDSKKYHL